MSGDSDGMKVLGIVFFGVLHADLYRAYHITGGGRVFWVSALFVALFDLLVLGTISMEKVAKWRCKRYGHPSWNPVSRRKNHPYNTHRKCDRCGVEEPLSEGDVE